MRNTTLTRRQQWTFTALVRCARLPETLYSAKAVAVVNVSQMKNIDRLTDWQVVAFVRLNATYQYVRGTVVARCRSQSTPWALEMAHELRLPIPRRRQRLRIRSIADQTTKTFRSTERATKTIVINIFNIYCRQSE